MSLPPGQRSYFDKSIGSDVVFVKQPPPELQLECSICLQLLDKPCILNCNCGENFCKQCIEQVLWNQKPCPLCNEKFDIVVENKQLERSLKNFPRHPVHKDQSLGPECECEFAYAGCKKKFPRNHTAVHMVENIAEHMSLLARQHQKDHFQIVALKETIKKSKPPPINPPPAYTLPLKLTISDAESLRLNDEVYVSDPFYLKSGYKMVLEVYPDYEDDEDAYYEYSEDCDNFLSVYLYIIKGEFDDQLKWPFVGSVYVSLIDQKEGNNETATAKYYPGDTRGARRLNDALSGRNGWPEFMELEYLYPNYLRKNRLVFLVESD